MCGKKQRQTLHYYEHITDNSEQMLYSNIIDYNLGKKSYNSVNKILIDKILCGKWVG